MTEKNAPTPTTPATAELTPEQRENALAKLKHLSYEAGAITQVGNSWSNKDEVARAAANQFYKEVVAMWEADIAATRAAAALDAEAARREAQHAELRGWGVMRPDGTLTWNLLESQRPAENLEVHLNENNPDNGYRAVPVRLTTEGASDE